MEQIASFSPPVGADVIDFCSTKWMHILSNMVCNSRWRHCDCDGSVAAWFIL